MSGEGRIAKPTGGVEMMGLGREDVGSVGLGLLLLPINSPCKI